MGNFLVIMAPPQAEAEAARLFQAGLANAQQFKKIKPSALVDSSWVKAASFARQNGSGSPIVVDPATKCWLLAAGTWFHADDYASGAETRLLSRIVEIGGERLARELCGGGVPVLWVTHDLAQADRIADTVVRMDDGRVVASAPAGDRGAG